MKKEISAGGIIVRKRKTPEVLLMKDMNRNWTFPKGIIEFGEEPLQAAKREIQEETGVTDITLHSQLEPVHYIYKRKEPIEKTVIYFLFLSEGNDMLVPQREEGIHELRWVPIEESFRLISYPDTNLTLLKAAHQKITAIQ